MTRGIPAPLMIDWVNPINWAHPFAQSLRGFWMGVPGATGGRILHDLTRIVGNGTLTNMAPETDWVPTQHGAALNFSGSGTKYVSCGTIPASMSHGTSGDFVYCFSAMVSSSASTTTGILLSTSSGAGTSGVDVIYAESSTAGRIAARNQSGTGGTLVWNGGVNDGVWRRYCYARKSGTHYLFANGVSVATPAASTGNATPSNALNLWARNGGLTATPGQLHTASCFSGCPFVPAIFAEWDYDQWRRGFPDLLNRQTRKRYYVPDGGGGGGNIPYVIGGCVGGANSVLCG